MTESFEHIDGSKARDFALQIAWIAFRLLAAYLFASEGQLFFYQGF